MTERFLTGTLKHQHRHSLRFTFNPDHNQSPYIRSNYMLWLFKRAVLLLYVPPVYLLLEKSLLKVS